VPHGGGVKDYSVGAAAAGRASEVSTQDPRCRDLAAGEGGGEGASILISRLCWALFPWLWEWFINARDSLEKFYYHVQQEFSCIWHSAGNASPLYNG